MQHECCHIVLPLCVAVLSCSKGSDCSVGFAVAISFLSLYAYKSFFFSEAASVLARQAIQNNRACRSLQSNGGHIFLKLKLPQALQ